MLPPPRAGVKGIVHLEQARAGAGPRARTNTNSNAVMWLRPASEIVGRDLTLRRQRGDVQERADLRDADLSRTIGLTQIQMHGTCGDETTKLPEGVQPPEDWPC